MSRKKKIIIIFHLCFACVFLSWLVIQPYVKEVAVKKSQLALYEAITKKEALFEALPQSEQQGLQEGYAHLKLAPSPPFFRKSQKLWFQETSPFALAWLIFSLVTAVLLLLRVEGAALTAWLLPLLVLGYAYFLKPPPPLPGSLFPSESYVLQTYVSAEERGERNYREALLLGWHRYLVAEWAHEVPAADAAIYQTQLERALFAFNVARLKWIIAGKEDEMILAGFTSHPSGLRIFCYFIWNLFFAWFLNRKEKIAACGAAPSPQA